MTRVTIPTGKQWPRELPETWMLIPSKGAFSERREKSIPDDVHLTPSQAYGILPQAEYIAVSGNRVVQNLEGQDNMKHVEPDDFVIHLRSFQGGIEWSGLTGKVSMAYTVLTPRNAVLPAYYRWLLKSEGYIQELRSTTDQLRDGQSISYTTFGKVPLPLPPRDEQQHIASYLDRETAEIDAFIADQECLIELLNERRGATIASMLNADESVSHVPLKYCSEMQTGLTLGKTYSESTTEYPYLRVANVQVGGVALTNVTTIAVPEDVAASCLLRENDVLMTEGGDRDKLGRGAIWHAEISPCLHQNHVFAIRCDQSLLPEYLVYVLEDKPARAYFEVTGKQTTNLASTNSTIVKSLRLPLPSVDRQTTLVKELDERLGEITAMITDAQQAIALSRERRSALITAVVTGQIEVPS